CSGDLDIRFRFELRIGGDDPNHEEASGWRLNVADGEGERSCGSIFVDHLVGDSRDKGKIVNRHDYDIYCARDNAVRASAIINSNEKLRSATQVADSAERKRSGRRRRGVGEADVCE